MAGFKSNVADRFAPESKVNVLAGIGGEKLSTATVDKTGLLEVSGLELGWNYVLEQDGVRLSFLAKDDGVAPDQKVVAKAQADQGGLPSAAPGYSTQPNVITGARGSKDVKARHQPGLLSEDRVVNKEAVPRPHLDQRDVPKGEVQRSDTAFGEATPKDKGEEVPAPAAEDSKGLQRSDTEFGEASPKPRDEVQPAVDQEDAPKGMVQSSDTPQGEITPKPKTATKKAAVAQEKAAEGSTRKVSGDTAKTSKRAAKKQ